MHEISRRGEAALVGEPKILESKEALSPLVFNIIDDTRLEYEETVYDVEITALALNGLIRCRQEPARASEIRDVVGYDASHSSFKEDMDTLTVLLTQPPYSSSVIITGSGTGKRYQLAPRVSFHDRRHDSRDDPKLRGLFYGVAATVPSLDTYDGATIEFNGAVDRRRTISAMMKEVSAEPLVQWFGAQLMEGGWPARLESENISTNLDHIERALVAFLQPQSDPADKTIRQTMIDGTMSFQELFFSTYRQIEGNSTRFSEPMQGRMKEELFQVASEAVMEYIMTFDRRMMADDSNLGDYFYRKMRKVIEGTMRRCLEIDRWRHLGASERKVRLIRRVLAALGTLESSLWREPSPGEVASYLHEDTEAIAECLYLLGKKNPSLEEWGGLHRGSTDFYQNVDPMLYKHGHVTYAIDDALEDLEHVRQVGEVFNSDSLTVQEKIAMSVFFGVYMPHLGGEKFLRRTRRNDNPFTYPEDEDDFLEITRKAEGSPLHSGRVLIIDRNNFSALLGGALKKSREILKDSDKDW